jgi:predicted  nucleic acid-binding Zn-ribbon protein
MATSFEMSQISLNAQEMKELKRVFDYLANYVPIRKLRTQMQPLVDRRSQIQAHQKSSAAIKVTDKSGSVMTEEAIEAEFEVLEHEIHDLEDEMEAITSESDKKIRMDDLMEAIKNLGKKYQKVMPHSFYLTFTLFTIAA